MPSTAQSPLFHCTRALLVAALIGAIAVLGRWWSNPVPRSQLADEPLDYRVDVNRADPAALELLPGIGPAIADRVVAERHRRRFQRPADLERVPMIGPVTRARITPYIRFGRGAGGGRASVSADGLAPSVEGGVVESRAEGLAAADAFR